MARGGAIKYNKINNTFQPWNVTWAALAPAAAKGGETRRAAPEVSPSQDAPRDGLETPLGGASVSCLGPDWCPPPDYESGRPAGLSGALNGNSSDE